MEERKKLKRLSLKKEEIVNLNEYQMEQMKGGSSYVCSFIASVELTIATYSLGKDESWWNCPASQQANCMTDISKQFMTGGCLMPDVVIYSWK